MSFGTTFAEKVQPRDRRAAGPRHPGLAWMATSRTSIKSMIHFFFFHDCYCMNCTDQLLLERCVVVSHLVPAQVPLVLHFLLADVADDRAPGGVHVENVLKPENKGNFTA